jgi:hypothetical protein
MVEVVGVGEERRERWRRVERGKGRIRRRGLMRARREVDWDC